MICQKRIFAFFFLIIGIWSFLPLKPVSSAAYYCHKKDGCYETKTQAEMDACPEELWNEVPCQKEEPTNEGKILTQPVGEEPASGQKGSDELKVAAEASLNPMEIDNPYQLLGAAVNALMAFMGSIALLLYIFAGFMWMSAGGNSEKLTKAKNILIWTTLGIVAMGASYMVVRTILQKIG